MNSEDFISLNEITLLLGISAGTLARMVRDGRFPASTHRRGTKRYWRIADVHDHIGRLQRPIPLTAEARTQ